MRMFHRKYEKLAVLSVYEELSDAERKVLSTHLLTCEKCRRLSKRTVRMAPTGVAASGRATAENRLPLMRASLRNELKDVNRIRETSRGYGFASFPRLNVATVGLGVFLLGAASSYLFFGSSGWEKKSELSAIAGMVSQGSDNVSIGDVRFASSGPRTGEIDFSFNLVKHYQVRSDIDNRDVQKVLAYALVNSDNPGTRIKTVDMLNSVVERPDSDVEDALIKAAESDNNPGVRRAALLSLAKMKFDSKTKDALLYVLQRDPNPGMRVAAINILSEKELSNNAQSDKNKIDPQVLQVLRQRIESDQNLYVRTKAADILKEYKEM